MAHIFISHSTKDKEYVRKLEAELRKRGFDIWVDDQAIGAGEQWMTKLEQAVNNCAALIVVMTSNSADPNSWVHKEVGTAIKRKKPIFPLLLGGDVFFSLSDLQYTDVTKRQMPPKRFYRTLEKVAKPLVQITEPELKAKPASTKLARQQEEVAKFESTPTQSKQQVTAAVSISKNKTGLLGHLTAGLIVGMFGGGIGGLTIGLTYGLYGGISGLTAVLYGLFGGLFGGLIGGLIVGLFGRLIGRRIGGGLVRIFGAVISGLVVGLFGLSGLLGVLIIGPIIGLIIGLIVGLITWAWELVN
jgi:hypothetical protein